MPFPIMTSNLPSGRTAVGLRRLHRPLVGSAGCNRSASRHDGILGAVLGVAGKLPQEIAGITTWAVSWEFLWQSGLSGAFSRSHGPIFESYWFPYLGNDAQPGAAAESRRRASPASSCSRARTSGCTDKLTARYTYVPRTLDLAWSSGDLWTHDALC